jgi:formylglycine-generating enzyme required for sulfatase activity
MEGTRVPKARQLPDDLKDLVLRNGLDVRHANFHNDMDKLVRSLRGRKPTTAPAISEVAFRGSEPTTFSPELTGPPTTFIEPRHADGRIKVDARIVHDAPDGWFLPGNGKVEWFQDYEGGPEMVVVPAGTFQMGSPQTEEGHDNDEDPQHPVTFANPFAVGRFAVTFDQWNACAAEGGCNGYRPDDNGWRRGQRPVINVSWNDAKAYVDWLAKKTGRPYRLLSEAEWEYVARARSTTAFWWGDSISTNQANFNGNYRYPTHGLSTAKEIKGEYRQRTTPVNSFDPNPWGLYQVHGNVWEWTTVTLIVTTGRQLTARFRPVVIVVTVWSVAVPGTAVRRASARPTATGTPATCGPTTWASGLGGRSYLLDPLLLYLLGPGASPSANFLSCCAPTR